MKKILIPFIFMVLTGCFGRNSTVTTGQEGKLLPSFNLLLIDSLTSLDTKNIPVGEPIVLFYFSPYCPYCRAQVQEIVDNMQSLNPIHFYLISNYPLSIIKTFYEHYQMNKYSAITVGQDNTTYFGNYYKVQGVPYIAIYGKDKKLKQALLGKVSTNLIKDIAFE